MNRSLTDSTPARSVRADAFVAQMHATDRAAVVRAIKQQDMAELERTGIARRIAAARQEAGLSQPEMAEALGVIPRTYQNYESPSKPRTPWGLMNAIATITGKTTEWLIHGDGKQAPDLLGVMPSSGQDQLGRIEALLQRQVTLLEQSQEIMLALAAGLKQESQTQGGPPWAALDRLREDLAARDREASASGPHTRTTSTG